MGRKILRAKSDAKEAPVGKIFKKREGGPEVLAENLPWTKFCLQEYGKRQLKVLEFHPDGKRNGEKRVHVTKKKKEVPEHASSESQDRDSHITFEKD